MAKPEASPEATDEPGMLASDVEPEQSTEPKPMLKPKKNPQSRASRAVLPPAAVASGGAGSSLRTARGHLGASRRGADELLA